MKSQIPSWNLNQKKVILRADLNVPVTNGSIVDDFRLIALQPTLDYMLRHHAAVILLTHMGRPNAHEEALSTKQLLPWFTHHGYSVLFAKDTAEAAALASHLKPGTILLLENVRFFPGEDQKMSDTNRNHDNTVLPVSRNKNDWINQLAQLADYYVQDGFGVVHRNDASVTLLPQLFRKDQKTVGFLVEKELETLTHLMSAPKRPFTAIIGGSKIADKVDLITHLLPLVDQILLCPAVVFTFMKARGLPIGASLFDANAVERCTTLLTGTYHNRLVFPTDCIVGKSTQGPYTVIDIESFSDDMIGIALGPKSVHQYEHYIKESKTILLAGGQGFNDKPETTAPMKALLKSMNDSLGTTIVAGGDSVATARHQGLDRVTHLSTGGGATLAYLGKQPLPGLIALQ